MSTGFRFLMTGALILTLGGGVYGRPPEHGKDEPAVRGHRQKLHFYPAASPAKHLRILFAPGDGGCRGFATTIAEELAKSGYDAYCFDTRHYLEAFTAAQVLSTTEIGSDFGEIARWIRQGNQERILFIGWSEGAGLGLAALADSANHDIFDGLVAISTPEVNLLAWHWTDLAASIADKVPHEPTFKSADFMAKVSPLPLFVIASTSDEYISAAGTRALFSRAREPKRLAVINARDHKYSGNSEGFFRTLREAVTWIEQQHH